ncbi:concanavalin A-like lectin/glucanase domain-containing protein [Lactifluus volemus]|nr:concanavalin A-like lectin/glucanase domain-containing protein [Lactifluus volemus]
MIQLCLLLNFLSLFLLVFSSPYNVVREYHGSSFFDQWEFYGDYDNLTLGDVKWLDRNSATQQGLVYINEQAQAIIRVDNSSQVPFNDKRNSIRITSQDFYGIGSLWIIDLSHIPYGCSVWPAVWSKGPTWPQDGEIDIVEGVNLVSANQYTLHTSPGCSQAQGVIQKGTSGPTDCSQSTGCTVTETQPNTGGGVYATQFDASGISTWFWSRGAVPPSILQATSTSSIDPSDWGTPSASFPVSGCNIAQFFTGQQLVIDITLCGVWAGNPTVYNPQCLNSGPTGICYNDNVVGPGSPKYDNAFFAINYIRAYKSIT